MEEIALGKMEDSQALPVEADREDSVPRISIGLENTARQDVQATSIGQETTANPTILLRNTLCRNRQSQCRSKLKNNRKLKNNPLLKSLLLKQAVVEGAEKPRPLKAEKGKQQHQEKRK